jgi:hypothetical protein
MNNTREIIEIFADGQSRLMLGYPVSKVFFHSQTDGTAPDNSVEVLRLAIPTTALIQLCNNVLATICNNRDAMIDAANFSAAQSMEIIRSLNIEHFDFSISAPIQQPQQPKSTRKKVMQKKTSTKQSTTAVENNKQSK